MVTTGEIDILITQTHWKYLHAIWEWNAQGAADALTVLDALLDERWVLCHPTCQAIIHHDC